MQALQLLVLEFVTLRPQGGATTTCITMGSIAVGFLIKYTSLIIQLSYCAVALKIPAPLQEIQDTRIFIYRRVVKQEH